MTERMMAEMQRGIEEYRRELSISRIAEEEKRRRLEETRRRLLEEKRAFDLEIREREALRQQINILESEVGYLRGQSYSMGVIKRTAAEFAVSEAEICGSSRSVVAVWARNVCAYVLRERGFSLCQIGRVLKRHHTSILHGITQTDALAENENLKAILERVKWPVQ